jgi:hypothetical protein
VKLLKWKQEGRGRKGKYGLKWMDVVDLGLRNISVKKKWRTRVLERRELVCLEGSQGHT